MGTQVTAAHSRPQPSALPRNAEVSTSEVRVAGGLPPQPACSKRPSPGLKVNALVLRLWTAGRRGVERVSGVEQGCGGKGKMARAGGQAGRPGGGLGRGGGRGESSSRADLFTSKRL